MNMKIDDDLIASFSNLVLKSFEINIEYVITSKHFSDILNLLMNFQENISSPELNQQLTIFFTTIIITICKKYERLSQSVQESFKLFLKPMLKIILITLTKLKIHKEL